MPLSFSLREVLFRPPAHLPTERDWRRRYRIG
jgi:hypothetical protein